MSRFVRHAPGAVLTSVVALVLVLVASSSEAAWPTTPLGNLLVGTPGRNVLEPVSCSDSVGGVIIAWRTDGPESDIYAQRIRADGSVAWHPDGVLVCGASDTQDQPSITSDGRGGAIVAWNDERTFPNYVHAQRIDSTGARLWIPDGVPVSTTHHGFSSELVGDGAGGAIVGWRRQDVYAQRIDSTGSRAWPEDAVLCAVAGTQWFLRVAADASGGAIVTWIDNGRGGALYAQRVTADGEQLWTPDGAWVSDTTGAHAEHVSVSDGAGGAYIAWHDQTHAHVQHMSPAGQRLWPSPGIRVSELGCTANVRLAFSGSFLLAVWQDCRSGNVDVYAQSFDSSGAIQWAPDGVPVCAVAGAQRYPDLADDGCGGAVIAWHDERVPDRNLYVQRIDSVGTRLWQDAGVELSTALHSQEIPRVLSDGRSGMLVRWHDQRTGMWRGAAQRVNRDGILAGEEPVVRSVNDVPADQGGALHLHFGASMLDVPGAAEIAEYDILTRTATEPPWNVFATLQAMQQPAYGLTVPGTTSFPDSVVHTAYAVRARHIDGVRTWQSLPDSGIALDNLPPDTPALLDAFRADAEVTLRWTRNREPDLDDYLVYADTSETFVPSDLTLLLATSDTVFTAAGLTQSVFKILARDVHGNTSAPATAVLAFATGLTSLGSTSDHPMLVIVPNPTAHRVMFLLTLATPSRANLSVFDPQGRRVFAHEGGVLAAGTHRFEWDGRTTDGGTAAGGLYWARLDLDRSSVVRSLTLLR